VTVLVSAEGVITSDGRIGDAILVEGGNVVAIGSRSDLVTPHVTEERYPGAWIIPGLRDAHLHPVPYAALLSGCSLKTAGSIDGLVQRLAAYAAGIPTDSPVVATRFDDEHLTEHRLPTREDLDRAVPDRPAVIYRYCGHVAVANSRALAASGITADTPDPDGGTIDRDRDGQPTGVLRETAAGLITPALSRGGAVDPDALVGALRGLAGLGLTSIGAMIGYGESPSEKLEAEVELWCSVAPRLPITVHGFVITDSADQLAWAADRMSHAGRRLRWRGVKRFADGSLGGHTAAMRHPYADHPTSGTLRLTQADESIARTCIELGGTVAIHAIGDRAVEGVLDVFDRLRAGGASPSSLRMEHASIADPGLIDRLARTGAHAVIQPAFLASESAWVTDRVGPKRAGWVYPFRSMRDAGIPLAGSSDSPVEPPHPLWGMAAAVDRHGISVDEALTALQALRLFTDGAAAALGEPRPLASGSPADFVVLDTDLRSADPAAIRDAVVLDTWVDGTPVPVDRSRVTWVD
jgi:predicted amidohydrolase YtcJ